MNIFFLNGKYYHDKFYKNSRKKMKPFLLFQQYTIYHQWFPDLYGSRIPKNKKDQRDWWWCISKEFVKAIFYIKSVRA